MSSKDNSAMRKTAERRANVRIESESDTCEALLEVLRCGVAEVTVSGTYDSRRDPGVLLMYVIVHLD